MFPLLGRVFLARKAVIIPMRTFNSEGRILPGGIIQDFAGIEPGVLGLASTARAVGMDPRLPVAPIMGDDIL